MAIPTAPVRLTLPEARPRYDADNEQETRRLVELAFQRLPEPPAGIEEAGNIIRMPFVILWNTDATVADIPASTTEIDATNKRLRRVVDLNGMRAARLVGNISAGATGASFRVEFSTDGGIGWADLGCQLSAETTGQPVVGEYAPIPLAAATENVILRPVTVGGNSVVDVTFSWLEVQFSPTLPAPVDIEGIPGFRFWFESDFGVFSDTEGTTPQTTDGGIIRHWRNKIAPEDGGGGNASNFGNGPTLDKTNTLNGFPVLRFNGSPADLQALILPTDGMAGMSEAELFMVLKTDLDPNTQFRSGLYLLGHTGTLLTHYPYTDGVVYCNFGSTSRKTCGNPSFPLTQWHVHGVYSAPNDWALMINGAPLFVTSTNTVSFGSQGYFIGYSGEDNSFQQYSFNGHLAALLLFAKKLTPAERAAVLNYLGNKYAL